MRRTNADNVLFIKVIKRAIRKPKKWRETELSDNPGLKDKEKEIEFKNQSSP